MNFYDAGNQPWTIAGVVGEISYPSTAYKGKAVFIIHPINDPEATIAVNQQFIVEITTQFKQRTVTNYIVHPKNGVVPMPSFVRVKWVDQIWITSCYADDEDENTHVGIVLCNDGRETGYVMNSREKIEGIIISLQNHMNEVFPETEEPT